MNFRIGALSFASPSSVMHCLFPFDSTVRLNFFSVNPYYILLIQTIGIVLILFSIITNLRDVVYTATQLKKSFVYFFWYILFFVHLSPFLGIVSVSS